MRKGRKAGGWILLGKIGPVLWPVVWVLLIIFILVFLTYHTIIFPLSPADIRNGITLAVQWAAKTIMQIPQAVISYLTQQASL